MRELYTFVVRFNLNQISWNIIKFWILVILTKKEKENQKGPMVWKTLNMKVETLKVCKKTSHVAGQNYKLGSQQQHEKRTHELLLERLNWKPLLSILISNNLISTPSSVIGFTIILIPFQLIISLHNYYFLSKYMNYS